MQQRRQQRAVTCGEPDPVRTELPLQDRELVAQREDLCVFVPAAHRQQPQQREHVRHTKVGQSQRHGPSQCHSVPVARVPRRPLSRTTSGPPVQRLQPAWMRFSAGAGMGTTRMAPSGRCLRPRGSNGVPVLVQAAPVRGQAAVRIILPCPWAGRIRSARRRATASSGAAPRSTGSRRTRPAPA